MARKNNQNQNAGQNTNQNSTQSNQPNNPPATLNPNQMSLADIVSKGGSVLQNTINTAKQAQNLGFDPNTNKQNIINYAVDTTLKGNPTPTFNSGQTINVGGQQVPALSIYPPGSTTPIQVPVSNTSQIQLLLGLGGGFAPATSLSGLGEFGSQLTAGRFGLNPFMGMFSGFNPYMGIMGGYGGFGGGSLNPFAFMMPGFGGSGLNPYMGMMGGGLYNNLFPSLGNFGNGGGLTGDLFNPYWQNYPSTNV